MGCYYPRVRSENLGKWEVAADGHLYHPATIYGWESFYDIENLKKYSGGQYKNTIIGCRECIGCKLDSSRDWANRGYLESLMYPKGQCWFVTLTYDDSHMEIMDVIETSDGWVIDRQDDWNGVLVPHDLKLFTQNLRRKRPDAKIRYMACGEYGCETRRPHYHLIIYGLELKSDDLYNPRIINGNIYYQSRTIESSWVQEHEGRVLTSRGISNVSEISWNNIAYTARYITKKINGAGSELYYAMQGQIKEFFRVSNRPGIGYLYYEKYKDKIYKNDCVVIKNQEGVITTKPPKYFDHLYEMENPEHFAEIKAKREASSNFAQQIKDLQTSKMRRERLMAEARAKESQAKQLRRTLEGH